MFWRKKPQAIHAMPERKGIFSTDLGALLPSQPSKTATLAQATTMIDGTMDSAGLYPDAHRCEVIPDAQFYWYASQSFIGYQAAAVLAQHWLVDKACRMPARDAIRQGYEIHCDDESVIDRLQQLDKRYNINSTMRQFIHFGRVYGIRLAIFKVDSPDPEYYEKPFNIDGIQPGSYKGVSQVDPTWASPILTDSTLSDPASSRFYEPTFYLIGGRKYHHSHLAIFIPHPVTDVLKPAYQYGGIPLPQLIYERVYAAERTANEGPQLAMTKRTGILKVNSTAFFSDLSRASQNLMEWIGLRDNYGVKVIDKEAEDYTQFDTGLADLDATIMTQYQLVAAIANVPATKLLGTTPKGFNSSGDYESANYREEMESVQTNDLTPLLERHHQLLMRSELQLDMETSVSWMPLDSPTAAEWAAINLQKAQTAQVYAGIGAIDGMDVRDQLKTDKNSDFHGLADIDEAMTDPDEA